MEEKHKRGRPPKNAPIKKMLIPIEEEPKKEMTEELVNGKKANATTNILREMSNKYDNPRIKPGDNSRFVLNAMASLELEPIDTSDPEQVKQRCYDYLKFCADRDRRPQIVGLANWLGISRQALHEWVNSPTGNRKEQGEIIKRVYSLMEEMWTEYMQYGKISPPTAIFLAKNWYGYRDETNIVLTPNNPLQNLDDEQATQRIMEAIPMDDE